MKKPNLEALKIDRDSYPLGASLSELLYDRWVQDQGVYYIEENNSPIAALKRTNKNGLIAHLAKKYGPYVITYFKRQIKAGYPPIVAADRVERLVQQKRIREL